MIVRLARIRRTCWTWSFACPHQQAGLLVTLVLLEDMCPCVHQESDDDVASASTASRIHDKEEEENLHCPPTMTTTNVVMRRGGDAGNWGIPHNIVGQRRKARQPLLLGGCKMSPLIAICSRCALICCCPLSLAMMTPPPSTWRVDCVRPQTSRLPC